MRYYIEAFDQDGQQVLGNLDGQAALGELSNPTRSKKWRNLQRLAQSPEQLAKCCRRARLWHLVNANGTVLGRVDIRNT
jgi:hypothetical protein